MTNAVSRTNVINNAMAQQVVAKNQDDVKKLVKYVSGEALTQAPDTFTSNVKSATGSALLFDGTPLALLALRNVKAKGIGSKALKNLDTQSAKNVKKLFEGEGKLGQRITDFIVENTKNREQLDTIKDLVKKGSKADKAAAKAAKAAAKAEKGGVFSKFYAKKAAKAAAKSDAARVAANTLEELGKGSKSTALVTTTGKTAGKAAGKLGNFGKIFKSSGAGFMLALSGIIEGVTEVVPTFKELGKEKGMKQLGKSTVKVVGDTAGFVVGNQLGAAAGAALASTKLGAAIGSVVPGFGTAIGAVVGCVCGFLGSWVAGKITKKITGKSEREKAKEVQEQQQAEMFANNSKSLEELKAAAALKIQEEYATTGKISPDSEEALKILQNLEETNPYQVA